MYGSVYRTVEVNWNDPHLTYRKSGRNVPIRFAYEVGWLVISWNLGFVNGLSCSTVLDRAAHLHTTYSLLSSVWIN